MAGIVLASKLLFMSLMVPIILETIIGIIGSIIFIIKDYLSYKKRQKL